MVKLFIIFWLISFPLLAQQKPDAKDPEEEVYGLILNGNKSILISGKGMFYGKEEELYKLYFREIYSDSTQNEILVPVFSGRRIDYFNPVVFLILNTDRYNNHSDVTNNKKLDKE